MAKAASAQPSSLVLLIILIALFISTEATASAVGKLTKTSTTRKLLAPLDIGGVVENTLPAVGPVVHSNPVIINDSRSGIGPPGAGGVVDDIVPGAAPLVHRAGADIVRYCHNQTLSVGYLSTCRPYSSRRRRRSRRGIIKDSRLGIGGVVQRTGADSVIHCHNQTLSVGYWSCRRYPSQRRRRSRRGGLRYSSRGCTWVVLGDKVSTGSIQTATVSSTEGVTRDIGYGGAAGGSGGAPTGTKN